MTPTVGMKFRNMQTFSAYKAAGRTGIKVLFNTYVITSVNKYGIYFAPEGEVARAAPAAPPTYATFYMSPAKWDERVADNTLYFKD